MSRKKRNVPKPGEVAESEHADRDSSHNTASGSGAVKVVQTFLTAEQAAKRTIDVPSPVVEKYAGGGGGESVTSLSQTVHRVSDTADAAQRRAQIDRMSTDDEDVEVGGLAIISSDKMAGNRATRASRTDKGGSTSGGGATPDSVDQRMPSSTGTTEAASMASEDGHVAPVEKSADPIGSVPPMAPPTPFPTPSPSPPTPTASLPQGFSAGQPTDRRSWRLGRVLIALLLVVLVIVVLTVIAVAVAAA